MSAPGSPRVGLFVTCLVDLMRPSVGFAAAKLLEDAGCTVEVPVQTCCGQPAYNSGDRSTTRDLAETMIETFRLYDYVVAPSGSCAGMIKTHYPELFADDPTWRRRADELASRTHELTSFLVDVLGVQRVDASFEGAVTYHDACSGLRELGVRNQPRKLLQSVSGLTLVELSGADVCCGFGGTFAVKYADISNAIVSEKAKAVVESGAPTLLAGDMGLPDEHGGQALPGGPGDRGAARRGGPGRHDGRARDRTARGRATALSRPVRACRPPYRGTGTPMRGRIMRRIPPDCLR
jgi:L-lactate dehydrogenase complex protein LldE